VQNGDAQEGGYEARYRLFVESSWSDLFPKFQHFDWAKIFYHSLNKLAIKEKDVTLWDHYVLWAGQKVVFTDTSICRATVLWMSTQVVAALSTQPNHLAWILPTLKLTLPSLDGTEWVLVKKSDASKLQNFHAKMVETKSFKLSGREDATSLGNAVDKKVAGPASASGKKKAKARAKAAAKARDFLCMGMGKFYWAFSSSPSSFRPVAKIISAVAYFCKFY